jgi:DNA-binding NarL/FixJ family response regulator
LRAGAQVFACRVFFRGMSTELKPAPTSAPSSPAGLGTRTVRVLLADDESLFIEALAAMLEVEDGVEVVGRAHDGLEALRLASSVEPDIVLMDLRMPRLNGIEATRRLRTEFPSVKVLIVTGSDAPADIESARQAGAAGYVKKERVGTDLTETMFEVAA